MIPRIEWKLATIATAIAMMTTGAIAQTMGPGGESPTLSSEVTLTDAEVQQIKDMNATAALLWHTSSDFVNAVTAGAEDEFNRLGVEVVATTDAGFDSARQMSDIETVLAKNPSAILALPLDPTTSAQAFKAAVDDGVKIVLLSNVPSGYVQGED